MIKFPTYRFDGQAMSRRPRPDRSSHEHRVRILHRPYLGVQILRWQRRKPRLLRPHRCHAEINLWLVVVWRTRGNVGNVGVLSFGLMCLKRGVVTIVFMSMVRCNLSLPKPRVAEECDLLGWGNAGGRSYYSASGKLFKLSWLVEG